MYKEHKIEKVYYKIGEVVVLINERLKLTGSKALTASALRFYESLTPKLRASKVSSDGQRRYTQSNMDNIERFMRAVVTGYFTMAGCVAILNGTIRVSMTRTNDDV